MSRRPPWCTAVAVITVAVVSCSSESAPVPEDRPPHLVPLASTTSVNAGPVIEVGRTGLTVTSPDVVAGSSVPARRGLDPPRLTVESVPAEAVEIAVHVVDVATERSHWLVTRLDPEMVDIDGAAMPASAVVHLNEAGEQTWLPVVDVPAQLRVRVTALSAGVRAAADRPADALTAIDLLAIDTAALVYRVEV